MRRSPQKTGGKRTNDQPEREDQNEREHAGAVDAAHTESKASQFCGKVSRLLNERFRATVQYFYRTAEVFETWRRTVVTVSMSACVLKLQTDEFEHGKNRIVISDPVLALPFRHGMRERIIRVHAANLSAACASVRRRSAAR